MEKLKIFYKTLKDVSARLKARLVWWCHPSTLINHKPVGLICSIDNDVGRFFRGEITAEELRATDGLDTSRRGGIFGRQRDDLCGVV
jgi:hypothetical protein